MDADLYKIWKAIEDLGEDVKAILDKIDELKKKMEDEE